MRSCIGGPFLNKVVVTLCLILTDFARRIAGIAELMLFFLGLQATILTCIPVIHRIGRVLIGKTVRLCFFPAAIQASVGMLLFIHHSPGRIIVFPLLGNGRFLCCTAIGACKSLDAGFQTVGRLGLHTLIPGMGFHFLAVAKLAVTNMVAGIFIRPVAVSMATALGNRLGFCTTAGFAGKGLNALFITSRGFCYLAAVPTVIFRIDLTALGTGLRVLRIVGF